MRCEIGIYSSAIVRSKQVCYDRNDDGIPDLASSPEGTKMEALSLVHGEPTGTTSLFASLWKKGLILSKREREREKGLIVSLTTKWNYGLFFFQRRSRL